LYIKIYLIFYYIGQGLDGLVVKSSANQPCHFQKDETAVKISFIYSFIHLFIHICFCTNSCRNNWKIVYYTSSWICGSCFDHNRSFFFRFSFAYVEKKYHPFIINGNLKTLKTWLLVLACLWEFLPIFIL